MHKKEELLYPEIESWLKQYLNDKYKGYDITTTHKTSKISLDAYLKALNIEIKEAIGLSVKVDIVGVLRKSENIKLVFVEIKDNPLTLKDLGQLWGYTQLINPIESFLISSEGLGSLEYILNVLKREDVLIYGTKKERMMKICKWDINRKSIDYFSLVPKR